MALNFLIFFVILLLLFHNYKEGVMVISVLAPWLFMWKFPAGHTINLFTALSCVAILLLLTRLINTQPSRFKYFPFKLAVIPPFVSLIITSIFIRFKLVPLLENASYYIFPFALFYVIQKPDDLNRYLKYLSIFLLLIVGYTFYEEVTVSNPIMNWCVNHSQHFGWISNATVIRFGMKRAQSFLVYCSALGGLCNYSFFIIAYLRSKRYKYTNTPIFTFLLYALPICTFLTGTRSVIVSFFIICISFVTIQAIKRYKFVLLIVVPISILLLLPYFSLIGNSIIASDDDANRTGSSMEMREAQLTIATYYMEKAPSPWYGNGFDYTDKVKQLEWELYGAESIWFPRMIEQGYIGVICLAITFAIMLLLLYKHKMYACLWVMLSFIFGKTVSIMLGIEEGYYLLIFVIIYRFLQFTNCLPSKLMDKRS